MNIKIYEIESFKDLNLFWNMFYDYINYIFEISPPCKETFEYYKLFWKNNGFADTNIFSKMERPY